MQSVDNERGDRKLTIRKLLMGLAAVIAIQLFGDQDAFAGRPLTVNDVEPVDAGQWQVESGIGYRVDSESDHFDFPLALSYGLVASLEVGVGFGGQIDERIETENATIRETGLGDLTLGAKWKFAPEAAWLPAQALSPTLKLPTADKEKGLGSGETDYDLTWIVTKSLFDELSVHGNLGYTWVGDPDGEDLGDIVHFGVAAEYQILERVQWVGEIFAQEDVRENDTVWQYNTGFRWDARDGLTFDMAAGSKLHGATPDFTANMGVTWAF